jgi:hypothetical protein
VLFQKLEGIPAAVAELKGASLIQVLAGAAQGNPHHKVLLTVKTSSGRRPYVVADLGVPSFWRSDNVQAQWIGYDFKRRVIAKGYRLVVPDGATGPPKWVFEGTEQLCENWNESVWVVLEEESVLWPALDTENKVAEERPCRAIRIRPTLSSPRAGWEHTLCFSEIEVFGYFVE